MIIILCHSDNHCLLAEVELCRQADNIINMIGITVVQTVVVESVVVVLYSYS